MKPSRDIYLGIDLGTSTIKVVVARFTPDNTLEFLGKGEVPSLSMLKGEPEQPGIGTEQLIQAITAALKSAAMRDFPARIALALSGGCFQTSTVSTTIDIPGGLPVTENDCVTVMRQVYDQLNPTTDETAQKSVVPPGKFPLSTVVTRNFQLADGRVVFSPMEQITSSLTYNALFFAIDREQYQRLLSTVGDALMGQRIDFTVPVPLTISCAVCKPSSIADNLPLPLLIDLGAGVTSLSMPTPTGWLLAEQIAIGTDHLANDLSLVFELNDIKTARTLVRELGTYRCTAIPVQDGDARMLTIRSPQGTELEIAANDLENVVAARLRELFSIIVARLEENQAYDWLDQEVLLTGDGALIPRVTELAATILKRKVRLATPYQVNATRFFDTLPPRYTTICGLLRAARQEQLLQEARDQQGSLLDRAGNWLRKGWQALFEW